MKVGTKSLLFGVHQFLWHPLTVGLAWRRLYGAWPKWHEWIAIACHDLGYWGKPNMDGPEGRTHPILGARIAARIVRFFNPTLEGQTFNLTLYHSREYARNVSAEPSRLCWADKYCVCVEPAWFYLFRARLSGEIEEYMDNAAPLRDDFFLLRHTYKNYKGRQCRLWLDWYRAKVLKLPAIDSWLRKPTTPAL